MKSSQGELQQSSLNNKFLDNNNSLIKRGGEEQAV
jgi:hypothetical protein